MLTVCRRTLTFPDLVRFKQSSKAKVHQWDTYPEPTELLLIGCLTELVWTSRFKSSMSTPNTNLQTYRQKGISHAMSGTIFSIFLTSVISALCAALRISAWPAVPKRWRTESRQQDRDKVKADDDELDLLCLDKFFDCEKSDCVEKSGLPKAPRRTDWSSTRMTKRCLSGRNIGKPVAPGYPGYPGNPGNSGNSGTEGNDEDWSHNLHISTTYVLHMEKIFSIVRQRYGVSPRNQMKNLDMNTAIWDIFMSVTLLAALHLRKDYTENCDLPRMDHRNLWDSYFKWLRGRSRIRPKSQDWQRLIVSSLCGERERETILLTDRAVQLATARNLRLFWLSAMSGRYQCWTSQCMGRQDQMIFGNTLSQRFGSDRRGADGVRVENFTGFTTLGILDEIQKMTTESKSEAEHFKGRIIFMSMHNDIDWTKRGIKKFVLRMLSEVLSILEDSRKDIGRFWYLDPRRNATRLMSANLMENWRKLLKTWCSTLPEADILYFVSAAPWKEKNWKGKEKEWNPFTSTVVMKSLSWFFAQLFPSMSSVSAEQ